MRPASASRPARRTPDAGRYRAALPHARRPLASRRIAGRPDADVAAGFRCRGYDTPIDGLFLAGAGSHPGGGVSGVPGMNAARRILAMRGDAMTVQADQSTAAKSPHRPQQHALPHAAARHAVPAAPRGAGTLQEAWYDWARLQGAERRCGTRSSSISPSAARRRVFDISPMVKYRIEGPDAEAFLNRLTLRDVTKLKPGRVHYTAWCDDDGHVLDDGTLFRPCRDPLSPLLPGTAPALAAGQRHRLRRRDRRGDRGGRRPGAAGADLVRGAARAGFAGVEKLKLFDLADFPHEGGEVTISRTGFTGDLGYELFVARRARRCRSGTGCSKRAQLLGIRAIGYTALNRARIEAGLIVANADFVTAEHAIRADRVAHARRDRASASWSTWTRAISTAAAPSSRRARKRTLRHVLVGLEIEGNVPAEHAIVYHREAQEVGLVSARRSGRRWPSATSPSPALTRPIRRHGRPTISGSRSTRCASCSTRS